VNPAYVKSLHRDYSGEWDFDLALKPVNGFPAYIRLACCDSRRPCPRARRPAPGVPVLSMHSDEADIIPRLAPDRALVAHARAACIRAAISRRLHDLVLSRAEIRDEVFRQLFEWNGLSALA
jgi:alpha-beta hydrolase superfamily lysophospholipase